MPMQVAKEMKTLVDAGVNSFKFFMAYKGGLMVDDDLYLRGLARCKELGALPMVGTHRSLPAQAFHLHE